MYKKVYIITLLLVALTISSLFAQKSLERIANENGVEAETLFNDKKFVEAAQSFEVAIAKLEEAVKTDGIPIDNEKISRWLLYAFQGYYQGKKYEDALKVQNERIKLDPSNYKLISTKAKLLKSFLNRADEAIAALIKYNSTKRSFKVEKKIASYYSDLEDYENALVWYHKAYELKKDATLIEKIAKIYLKLDRNSEAITAYEKFIKTNPNESVLARTYMNLGSLYEDLEDTSNMIINYEKSLSIEYRNEICLKLIPKYYESKKFKAANIIIEKLLNNNPKDASAFYYRGLIKFDSGDIDGAKIDFQKIVDDRAYGTDAKRRIESINSSE